jgi:hypothetical protein
VRWGTRRKGGEALAGSTGRISVSCRVEGGVGEELRPAVVAPEGFQTQQRFVARLRPELSGPLEPALRVGRALKFGGSRLLHCQCPVCRACRTWASMAFMVRHNRVQPETQQGRSVASGSHATMPGGSGVLMAAIRPSRPLLGAWTSSSPTAAARRCGGP